MVGCVDYFAGVKRGGGAVEGGEDLGLCVGVEVAVGVGDLLGGGGGYAVALGGLDGNCMLLEVVWGR